MANNNNDTTTKLGIDVGQFKRGLQDAARQIKLANAEFKTASAGMDKWSKSTDGLQAKIKQLQSVLDAENKKLELQKQRLVEVEKEQGKNSAAADELRIAIANQEAAIAKTQRSLGYFNEQLGTVQKEEEKANSATGQLTKTITDQQEELDELKQKYANVVIEQGKNSKEAQELGKQITSLSGDLATNRQKMNDAEKAADNLDQSLDEAGESADKAANGGFTVLKGVMANLASQAIAKCIEGLQKFGSEIINVGKQAYSAYAEYEQLTGGVETLFGESADTVKAYAENAYKTAGMSANEYMETVTSFSASLLQGLDGDTAKAAKIADVAISDMSDNANKMGTSMESIQNAYQGFAKQNYTMLDNLKLGYGGTQAEMARLINDSGVLKGTTKDNSAEVKKYQDQLAKLQDEYKTLSVEITGQTAKHNRLTSEYKKAVLKLDEIAVKSGESSDAYKNQVAIVETMGDTLARSTEAMDDQKTKMADLKKQMEFTSDAISNVGKETEVTAETVKDVPFDKIIEAIHKTQEKIGMTGTTLAEAEDTIEGSSNAMKAAWQNLLVTVASGNGDMKKSVKTFTDSVEQYLKNAAPRVKKIVQNLLKTAKSLIRKYMPEIANTVFPVLEKLYKTCKTVVTFIVKNFDKIGPVVMGAVAAFTAFNAAMAISKTIAAVSTAVTGLTAGVGLATKAQTIWNAALSANPIGAVITAVAALTAAVVLLSNTQNKAKKVHEAEMAALEEERDAINSNVEAWDDLKKSQQEQIDAGMTELSYYDSLIDELSSIVDENGKVKKGYEERASFITSQLSEATGTEIELVDGVIKKYKEVKTAIEDVMKQKKAQIILDSQESLYREAITKQADALKNLNTIQDEYTTKKSELNKLEDGWAVAAENYLNSRTLGEASYYKMVMEEIDKRINATNEELSTIESNYKTQENLLSEYAYNIGQYEKNMQLAHAGNYDEMSTVTWNYVKDYQNSSDAQKQMLEDSIAAEETNLALLKKLKADGNTDIYDQQIKQSEKNLEQQKQDLEKYRVATKQGLDKVTVEWKDGLDKQLSELTDSKVEFKDAGEDQVQMYIDGVAQGKPKSKKEMAQLVTDTIGEISLQYTHAKEAGEDLIDGVNKGIANEKKQSGVFSTIAAFGQNLLAKLKKSLKEKSPSKATDEMGQYLLTGLQGGVKKQENKTIKQVSDVGENVLDAFNSELDQGAEFNPLGVKFEDAIKKVLESAGNSVMAKAVGIINDIVKLINNNVPGVNIPQLTNGKLSTLNGIVSATANDVKRAVGSNGVVNNHGGNVTYNFTQNNTSPKPLNRLEIYRQTKNQLNFAKGV